MNEPLDYLLQDAEFRKTLQKMYQDKVAANEAHRERILAALDSALAGAYRATHVSRLAALSPKEPTDDR